MPKKPAALTTSILRTLSFGNPLVAKLLGRKNNAKTLFLYSMYTNTDMLHRLIVLVVCKIYSFSNSVASVPPLAKIRHLYISDKNLNALQKKLMHKHSREKQRDLKSTSRHFVFSPAYHKNISRISTKKKHNAYLSRKFLYL